MGGGHACNFVNLFHFCFMLAARKTVISDDEDSDGMHLSFGGGYKTVYISNGSFYTHQNIRKNKHSYVIMFSPYN